MGEVSFMYGQHYQAIEWYSKSLAINPNFNNSQYGLAKTLTLQGKFDEALQEVGKALVTDDRQSRFLNLGGLILLWQGRPDDALSFIGRAMRVSHDKHTYYYNLGVALSKAGHYTQAEWFLQQCKNHQSRDAIKILFSLLENSIKAQDGTKIDAIAETIVQHFSIDNIKYRLEELTNDYRDVPVSTNLIKPILYDRIQKKMLELSLPFETNDNG